MNKKCITLESVRHIPIQELLTCPEQDLERVETEALKQIKNLKKSLREKTLALKWIQGIIRIKKTTGENINAQPQNKPIIMVVNLTKED